MSLRMLAKWFLVSLAMLIVFGILYQLLTFQKGFKIFG